MAKITFYGATGTVTGSRTLLDLDSQRFLIDCGMFQGKKENRLKNWDPFPVPPESVDAVLLTHAHIDHSGYLPRFCRYDFAGRIHATHATSDLCEILLKDSAHLQEEDAKWANKKGFSQHKPALPLYTTKDAENALTHFSPVHYGEDLFPADDIRVKFKDAGHILGSSLVDIKVGRNNNTSKVLFTGDLGRPRRPVLKDPVQVYNVDYLVIESTYGNRLHSDASPYEELVRVINESADRGGVLVIPSFAVGRTQTLLYVIRELEAQGKIPVMPIYIDSPMAIDATSIFTSHLDVLNLHAREQTLQGSSIFQPTQLKVCRSREESMAINRIKEKAIIISASGMITGGRILHHMRERLGDPKNSILFIGYQAMGTRGRTILEGAETVKIHGKKIPVKAQIKNIFGFSGHADYEEILAWLMGFNRPPKMTFINHGEADASEALAEKIRSHFGWEVTVPEFGENYSIDM
ncbi:MAG: MBL fold metallo-hydrolase [Candidatus Marinimicrobia bacterium]|nr:MBL fold metallo-hydrolase [Candidatus Neomarinimicrobiota bacterium]MCF7830231.1 MBL fold metallo-hydrolase [Candidatus Neomarinimicrobiota bacterium]MCF7882258.1 MBL fold metallo-hydrolase [Candidatus Neomarinimicrobiota bacterium]